MDNNLSFTDVYVNWIRGSMQEKQISNNVFRITTPFLDRNNDHVEVYVIKGADNSFKITDDGATIGELVFSGFSFKGSQKREDALNAILASHGVSLDANDEMYVEANSSDYAAKKHMLTQCMIKVSDMFALSQSNVKSFFLEDVRNFFDANNIRYTEGPSFVGKSKLVNNFDFVIPHYKDAPERIIRAANEIRIDYAKSMIFAWEDIKDQRPYSALYAFINDENKEPTKEVIHALDEYGIRHIPWSGRDKYIKELSA